MIVISDTSVITNLAAIQNEARLDPGESEAIALVLELKADLL